MITTHPAEPVSVSPSEYQKLTEFITDQFEQQRAFFREHFDRIDAHLDRIEAHLDRAEASSEPPEQRLARLDASLEASRGRLIRPQSPPPM